MAFKLPTPLHALIIGIDEYPKFPRDKQLQCAVNDAKTVANFLRNAFPKSNLHVTELYNAAATHHDITQQIKFLGDNPRIAKDDAILIYYAGHGATSPKPDHPDWAGWITSGSTLELLCPSDTSPTPEGSLVPGIPDRTIAALLDELSSKKGNNITVILDCCHSAGISRSLPAGNPKARALTDLPPISPDCDRAIWHSDVAASRRVGVADGFMGQRAESHVLLAACGRNEIAWELEEQGLFTRTLLEVLQRPGSDSFDYITLMRSLEDISKYIAPYTQTPHCEGVYKNRVLFDKTATPSDPSFISGQVESKATVNVILNAGKAQDIWLGAQVGIYVSNFEPTPTRPNPQLGVLRVTKVSGTHSTLSKSPSFDVPPLFYAKLLQHHPNETISIFSASRQLLEAALSDFLRLRDSDLTAEGVSFVDAKDLADVVAVIDNDQVVFERKDKIAFNDIGYQRLSCTAPLASPNELYLIIRAAARFNYHLQRKNASPNSIKCVLEFNEVHRTFSQNFRDIIMEPGPNLLKDHQAVITIEAMGNDDVLDDDILLGDKWYGFTIINPTAFALYPYLFAFDGVDLCIRECPLIAVGVGGTNLPVDPVVLPQSTFPIGYGASGAPPQYFSLDEEDTDVTFFKLFVTNTPTDFSFLAQSHPFKSLGNRRLEATGMRTKVPDVWGTTMATIICKRNR